MTREQFIEALIDGSKVIPGGLRGYDRALAEYDRLISVIQVLTEMCNNKEAKNAELREALEELERGQKKNI